MLFGVPRPMSSKTDFDFDRSGCQLMTRQLHKQDRSACQRRMDLAGRWWHNGRGYELIDLAKSICSADQSHLAQTKENSTSIPGVIRLWAV